MDKELKEANNLINGVLSLNEKGFGFVAYNPDFPDIFISPSNTNFAMDGDNVNVQITSPAKDKKGPEGKIVSISKRNFQTITGEFQYISGQENTIGLLKINDKKTKQFHYLISSIEEGVKVNDRDVVIAKTNQFPDATHPLQLTGEVIESIGRADAPGVDILQVVAAHKIPYQFSDQTLQEVQQINSVIDEDEILNSNRQDIRDQMLVTIDGEDTKDIDDAIVAWRLENGNFHLGVHIADVSHYVQPGTSIDEDAYDRGTSVYLTDRVIPMTPPEISNGIASLNPGVDRLAMSVEMEIDAKGEVIAHEIHQSVIKSHARMTYTSYNKILAGNQNERETYSQFVEMFDLLGELHEILHKKRLQRGAIEFDTQEASIQVDDDGHPINITVRQRGIGEKMIESMMLLANETVAQHFENLHVPFLYRVHETPDGERVNTYFEFMKAIGFPITADPKKLKPSDLQKALDLVEGKPEEVMVRTMMLRSMKQAKYSSDSLGHFGLGAQYYTHFTSPIRRYPDLVVHRLIKWYLAKQPNELLEQTQNSLVQIGNDTSDKERRAVDAEREVDDMKKAEYMMDKIGQEFDGVINSALKFGLFVSLPDTVEGLVHITNMKDDYYQFEQSHSALIGKKTHRIFSIGQSVRVKVLAANKEEKTVDFELVNPQNAPTTKLRVQESRLEGLNKTKKINKNKYKIRKR